ncbi:hypothetical protein L1987_36636 [Smallanthus sonchifolius]|uniref:Uncharacterized protein n=1 Tax=Smallanthus sonchifolius TaxID=185202 RepID=A0ACB9HFC9_9ASTR|nr:hypothetical protein L1987_36636 [Smallanthus sonchifolius]
MQPTYSTFSDLYAPQRHHQTSQYYSHFPTQNPNPYQQHHLQIEPHFTSVVTDPDPPGVDPYLRSYSIGGAYNAHRAGDLTYSHAIGAAPPPGYVSDLVMQNWAPKESVQQYRNALYAVGATVAQDVSQQLLPAIPTHSTWTNSNPVVQSHRHWKKIPKKTKIAQSAWCEICKIACNSGDVFYKHKLGKKHIKNVEKLISAASVASTSTTTGNPVIGPLEKSKKGNSVIKKKTETPQDLENKRMKVLQGGAAANAVRTCSICNVVCNSDTVFRFHLAGQKHASMVKKLHQAGVV